MADLSRRDLIVGAAAGAGLAVAAPLLPLIAEVPVVVVHAPFIVTLSGIDPRGNHVVESVTVYGAAAEVTNGFARVDHWGFLVDREDYQKRSLLP